MEIKIDLIRELRWYANYIDVARQYPNASKEAVVRETNKRINHEL